LEGVEEGFDGGVFAKEEHVGPGGYNEVKQTGAPPVEDEGWGKPAGGGYFDGVVVIGFLVVGQGGNKRIKIELVFVRFGADPTGARGEKVGAGDEVILQQQLREGQAVGFERKSVVVEGGSIGDEAAIGVGGKEGARFFKKFPAGAENEGAGAEPVGFQAFRPYAEAGPIPGGVGFENVVGEGFEHEWGVRLVGLGLGEGKVAGVDAAPGKHCGFGERGHGGDALLHINFETMGSVSH